MFKEIAKIICIGLGVWLLISLYDCSHSITVKGKSDTTFSQTIRVDTFIQHDTIRVKTKPKIVRQYLTHDTTEREPNYVYISCDSTFIVSDTGNYKGIKYNVLDTISGGRISGRSINFDIEKLLITKEIHDTLRIVRTDTVKIKSGKVLKSFSLGFLIGFGVGVVAQMGGR
jgi:hypothetical protein